MTGRQRLQFVIDTLRAHADEYRRRGVEHMAVFGSVARGEATEDSDVDIVVDLAPEAPVGLFELMDIRERSEQLLGGKVDLVTRRSLRPRFAARVAQDRADVF